MLNIIGAGLRGVKSLTNEEIEALRSSDIVYIDRYTSIPPDNFTIDLQSILSVPVKEAWREFVEGGNIVEESSTKNISFVVTGDALSATTHNEMRIEAIQRGIKVNVFENASVLNAVIGKIGLFHYKCGPPVSIPEISKNFYPISVIDKIYRNFKNGMHSILLIDLKNGQNIPFEDVRNTLERMQKDRNIDILSNSIIVASRLSFPDERLIYGDIEEINPKDVLSPYLIVVPSSMDENERRFVESFCSKI
ncbi:MAG: diphthine synthase [Thermoplasmata archaeon]